MPTFRLETEQGQWLSDVRLSAPDWKPGDRISRGSDALEVVNVRLTDESTVLVVKKI